MKKIQEGVVVEHTYYTVKLKNGEEITLAPTELGDNKPGDIIRGYVKTEDIQDKYQDGTYARSYTTYVNFIPEK